MKSVSVRAAAGTLKRKAPELAEEITKGTGTENRQEPSTSEGSHILKLKKAAFAADRLRREASDVPGGMYRWLKAQEEVARAEEARPISKRRKKVVKTPLTPDFIEFLRNSQPTLRSERYRRRYAINKYINGKWADYGNALVEQYDLFGHAEDEDELTDDEDDDVVMMRSLDISTH